MVRDIEIPCTLLYFLTNKDHRMHQPAAALDQPHGYGVSVLVPIYRKWHFESLNLKQYQFLYYEEQKWSHRFADYDSMYRRIDESSPVLYKHMKGISITSMAEADSDIIDVSSIVNTSPEISLVTQLRTKSPFVCAVHRKNRRSQSSRRSGLI